MRNDCKLEEFINNGLTPLIKCKVFDDIEMTFFQICKHMF